MDPLAYYATQSPNTDPGDHAALYGDLPRDIAGLCRVVQGLVIHYRLGEMFGYTIPQERICEIDTRDVAKMLARLVELDPRPLTEPREPANRLVGCCRDFATLFCSMARSRGIPARVRVGFAIYFVRDFNVDHAIAEVYDAAAGRWTLVDPELSLLGVEHNTLIDFDPLDVPPDRFLAGGLAWQRYRAGDDPKRYGVDPGSELSGSWFIMDKLVQDLATQNKVELLLWDAWGIMLDELTRDTPSADDLALLDHAAVVTQAGPDALDAARALYTSTPRLTVPDRVMRYSPAADGEPAEVAVAG
jgi:hypothetical protein